MPYTEKERKLVRALQKEYGARWEEVYHAMETEAAKGKKFTNIFSSKSKKKRRRK